MRFQVEPGYLEEISSLAAECVEVSELSVVPPGSEHPSLSDGGLHIEQVHENNTKGMELSAPGSLFGGFDVEDPTTLGVPWNQIEEIMSRISEDMVDVSLLDNRKLRFSTSEGFEYDLALVSTQNAIPSGSFPEIEYDSEIDCSVRNVEEAIKTCDLVGDRVHLEIRDDGLFAWASGDTDDVQEKIVDVDERHDPIHTLFGIDLLKNVLSQVESGNDVEVSLKYNGGREADTRNMPMTLNVPLCDGRVSTDLHFAPRNSANL